jgi:hypothetical protein
METFGTRAEAQKWIRETQQRDERGEWTGGKANKITLEARMPSG